MTIANSEEEIVIVTTDSLPGKKITQVLGMIEARGRPFGLKEEKSAQENLKKKVKDMGANAVVGYSYAKRWARGTAVIVE